MKTINLTLLVLVLSIGTAHAEFEILPYAGGGAIVASWAQAREVAVNPKFSNENSVLGDEPSLAEVNQRFAVLLASHVGVNTFVTNKGFKKGWNWGMLAFNLGYVIRNKQIGIGFKF